jgi:hypothetical protein
MEDIISSLQSVRIASYTVPRFVFVDLQHICECYVNGVTDINFGDVVHDTMHDANTSKANQQSQFTYKDLYHHLSDLLEARGVACIDDTLVHTYLEYYLEFISMYNFEVG